MAGILDGVAQRAHDVLAGEVELGRVRDVLRERLGGDRQLRAVDEVRVLEEVLEDRGDPANFVQVLHDVLA